MSLVETTACRFRPDTQADVVAFGALGFFDLAVAHLDALRHAAHRDRIGRIRAGALRGLDEALRQLGQRGLIEQIGSGRGRNCAKRCGW